MQSPQILDEFPSQNGITCLVAVILLNEDFRFLIYETR